MGKYVPSHLEIVFIINKTKNAPEFYEKTVCISIKMHYYWYLENDVWDNRRHTIYVCSLP